MARTALSLALLACLGLAILHLVSAQEQNQELEDKTPNNVALQIKPEEQKIRLLREADAKKKKKKKGSGTRKGKGKGKDNGKSRSNIKCQGKKGRCGKKGSGTRKGKGKGNGKGKGKGNSKDRSNIKCQGKKGRCRKKGKSVKKGRSGRKCGKKCRSRKFEKKEKKKKKKEKTLKKQNVNTNQRQACDVEALCQKIKNYIKYSNQLRKLRRINKTCSTMEKKRDKAGAGEFKASGDANDASDNDTVQAIADKLKNCTTTAKEKCETKAVPACLNTTLNAKCEAELDAWIKKFGPAKGSCLQASASCCACITAITPDPSADCLSFESADTESKKKKKICTGSGTDGSFGHCRKLQMEAAEKGPKAHKDKCNKEKGDMTTAKSSGRRMIFRNNLMKKFIKT